MKKVKNIDSYIKSFPNETQIMLGQLRALIKKTAPDAEEVLSYNMPAYKYKGMLVYFAGYANHVGLYPMPSAIIKFKKELTSYVTAKSTVQFPIGKKLPLGLIKKIIAFRMKENFKKAQSKAKPNTGEFPKISAPAHRALANAKIKTLKDLSEWTEADLLKLHGIGPSAIPVLKASLKAKGLSFKK